MPAKRRARQRVNSAGPLPLGVLPSLDQLEVSISALKEVLQLEGRLTPEERQVEVMA